MSTPDYDTMPAGPEMDRLVAEKVMGWRLPDQDDSEYRWLDDHGNPTDYAVESSYNWSVWSPSRNIAHAWEVVERLKMRSADQDLHIEHHKDSGWGVSSCDPGSGFEDWTYAPTPMLAICRSALKSVRQ